jgi:hypothetical protein
MAIQITKQEQTTQVTLTIPSAEADAIGAELHLLADELDTVLWALALLRTGHTHRDKSAPEGRPATLGDLTTAITDLEHRLTPRLQGIRDALIRQHAAQGGSYGALATAMDAPRSTAQRRRDAVTGRWPSTWETWATGSRA